MTGPGRLTPELALSLRGPAAAQISPDGERVVYTVSDLAADGTRHPLIELLVSAARPDQPGAAVTTLALPGPGNAASPCWSPDSAALACLFAPPDGEHGLLVARPWDGPPRPVPTGPGPASAPAWAPDGGRIAVLSGAADAAGLSGAADAAGPVQAGPPWWPAEPRERIWVVDLATGQLTPGSPPDLHVWEFAWSPDGRRFAAVVSDGPGEAQWFGCRLALVDAAGAQDLVTGLTREPGEDNPRQIYRQAAAPVWSPDGCHVAFVMGARSDRDIIGGDLCVAEVATGAFTNLTRGLPMTVTSVAWPAGGPLIFAAYDRGQQAVGTATLDGPVEIRWRDRAAFERFWPRLSASAAGLIATTRENPVTPREVWTAGTGPGPLSWRQLTRLNDAARSWPHPVLHDVSWLAEDGTELSGLLALPPDAAAPPLVTWVHGGPNFLHKHLFAAAASPWMLGALPELIAAEGLAVFLPNPRGSMGWGSDFAEVVIGDMGGADSTDILSGIDHCVARFGLDGTRLGIGGWSYGGFMSAWLIGRTRRFAAAVVGAGTCNWRSQHGTSSIGAWDEQYLRDDPYRVGGAYDTRSPLGYLSEAATPALIAHGTSDFIVPPGQALELAAALRRAGCPVRLEFYDGEGHDFERRAPQLRLAADICGWFRRWLLSPPEPPAAR